MTRELVHSGVAAPLTLKSALTVPASGGFNLVVWGDAGGSGWPSIPVGAAIVVTVGRGTPQEAKYLVSGVTSTVTESTLAVPDWGRGYDGTTPTDLPMGTLIEHTISAVEMAELNDISSRIPDSVSGELVFTETAQLLTNKTFETPVNSGEPATKGYVDGGPGFIPWDPGKTQQGLTFIGISGESKYARVGSRVIGYGAGYWTGTSSSADEIELPLPLPPAARTSFRTLIGSYSMHRIDTGTIRAEGNIVLTSAGKAFLTDQSGEERFYLRCIAIPGPQSSEPRITFTFDYEAG